jgi:hypothetical protein
MKKLKYILVSFILCIAALSSYAQNLVPNYSFEVYDTCPHSASPINNAPPWINPTNGTSDYFNSCSAPGDDGVPSNYVGNQNAKDGSAYVGIIVYANDEPTDTMAGFNYREYIQVKLTDTLITNKCYQLTFYVSIAENYDYYKVTNFGAYFSHTAIMATNDSVLHYTPQINYINPAGIGNTTNWSKVEGTFKATGSEQYMTIGNFNNDAATTHIIVNSSCVNGGFAYYYIDSVSLVQVVCTTGINEATINNETLTIYPNPSNELITINVEGITDFENTFITLFDYSDKLVLKEKAIQAKTQLNITSLSNGLYLLQMQNGNKIISKKFVKE